MIKIGPKFITIDGKRIGVRYSVGPWVPGVDPSTIKIRPTKQIRFPEIIRKAFGWIENDSDSQTDYFVSDVIRVTSSHPHYAQVKAACA